MKESEKRLGLLISGSGTTAEAIIKACQEGRIKKIVPVVVIASRTEAPGIAKAERLGIKTLVIQRGNFPSSVAFGKELLRTLQSFDVDFVSQNGWLVKTPANVVEVYRGRIINQHPGPLDPGREDFGGKGMYGARVTCSRLAYEWMIEEENPWTESTVHFVNEEYDRGDLVSVIKIAIPSLGRPVTLAELRKEPRFLIATTKSVQEQLLPLEHKNVIEALRKFAEGEVKGYRRLLPLVPVGSEEVLYQAKNLVRELFPKG